MMEALETLLVDAAIASASPALKSWYSTAELRRNFTTFLTTDLKRLDDLELAARFQHHCPVPGAAPVDYQNRLLALEGSGWALVGIRFRGLDLARPFVDLRATSRPLRCPDELSAVADRAAEAYRLFEPKHVRAFSPSHEALDLGRLGRGAFWERRLLAAPISVMRDRPVPESYDRVTLERSKDLSFYDHYAAAYDELHSRYPEHRDYVTVESLEDMRYYLEVGQVFQVHVDARWAGVVGCYPYQEQGLGGVTVAEMFLDSEHRGRRLGAAVQRQFVEAVQAELAPELAPELRLLWGSIDVRNVAAIRTALSCGRVDIGGYYWVPTPGLAAGR